MTSVVTLSDVANIRRNLLMVGILSYRNQVVTGVIYVQGITGITEIMSFLQNSKCKWELTNLIWPQA